MTPYTTSYGNTLAVRIMLILILIGVPVLCGYLIAKTIYTADQSIEGNVDLIVCISGIIGAVAIAIILIVCGVL